MSVLFSVLMVLSATAAVINGTAGELCSAGLDAAARAVALCIALCGGYAFWLGWLKTAREAGAMDALAKLLSPVLKKLFPDTGRSARRDIAVNLSANMLGMGNAATPSGLSAMKKMPVGARGEATRDMIMLAAVNISSVQLLPTGAMTVLAQRGASAPSKIILPSLAATIASTATAIISVFLLDRFWRRGA